VCVITQINYLNKALDGFNTAVVSPIYYVFFTSFTIIASTIMFKDWVTQTGAQLTLELTGFITILCGTALLHLTKDYDGGNLYTRYALAPMCRCPSSLKRNAFRGALIEPTHPNRMLTSWVRA